METVHENGAMNSRTMERSAELMFSNDYRARLAAEWGQVKIRLRKLRKLLYDHQNGKINFDPTCTSPITLLKEQELVMQEYVDILEKRIELEGINISEYFK